MHNDTMHSEYRFAKQYRVPLNCMSRYFIMVMPPKIG